VISKKQFDQLIAKDRFYNDNTKHGYSPGGAQRKIAVAAQQRKLSSLRGRGFSGSDHVRRTFGQMIYKYSTRTLLAEAFEMWAEAAKATTTTAIITPISPINTTVKQSQHCKAGVQLFSRIFGRFWFAQLVWGFRYWLMKSREIRRAQLKGSPAEKAIEQQQETDAKETQAGEQRQETAEQTPHEPKRSTARFDWTVSDNGEEEKGEEHEEESKGQELSEDEDEDEDEDETKEDEEAEDKTTRREAMEAQAAQQAQQAAQVEDLKAQVLAEKAMEVAEVAEVAEVLEKEEREQETREQEAREQAEVAVTAAAAAATAAAAAAAAAAATAALVVAAAVTADAAATAEAAATAAAAAAAAAKNKKAVAAAERKEEAAAMRNLFKRVITKHLTAQSQDQLGVVHAYWERWRCELSRMQLEEEAASKAVASAIVEAEVKSQRVQRAVLVMAGARAKTVCLPGMRAKCHTCCTTHTHHSNTHTLVTPTHTHSSP
jgi:hypothetical protein